MKKNMACMDGFLLEIMEGCRQECLAALDGDEAARWRIYETADVDSFEDLTDEAIREQLACFDRALAHNQNLLEAGYPTTTELWKRLAGILRRAAWSEEDVRWVFGRRLSLVSVETVHEVLELLGQDEEIQMELATEWLAGLKERAQREAVA